MPEDDPHAVLESGALPDVEKDSPQKSETHDSAVAHAAVEDARVTTQPPESTEDAIVPNPAATAPESAAAAAVPPIPDLGAKTPTTANISRADLTTPSAEERAFEARRRSAALFANSQVTVLQPMTNLRGWEMPQQPISPEDERTFLGAWTMAMERALREERPADAVKMSHVVLRHLPRHLGTYQRLVRAAWQLRRWEEGDAWGRRLLRADPASSVAWRAVAMAAEQRGERQRAHARWQRAFECDPYDPEIRAGLVRTSVDLARLPQLNEAALASLALRGFRWEQAISAYRRLIQQDSRRLDFQSGLLLAIWQMHYNEDAYELARELTQYQPYLLVAWTIIDETGDADDKALARHPVRTMDPDGDYLRTALGLVYPGQSVRMNVSAEERELLVTLSPGSIPTQETLAKEGSLS
jgi:tetratricopeptide (TPR) repeat protein